MIFPIVDIEFRKIHPAAIIPEYKTDGSLGIDLCPITYKGSNRTETLYCQPYTITVARTGLGISHITEGFHAEVYLRSSTGIKYPGLILANHVGIIDTDYIGPEDELYLLLHNTNTQVIHKIEAGERIAQLVIRKSFKANISEFKNESGLSLGSRTTGSSRGGLGSTG